MKQMQTDGGMLHPPLLLPATYNIEFAQDLSQRLDAATRGGVPIKHVLAADVAAELFETATKLLATEPTLVEAS